MRHLDGQLPVAAIVHALHGNAVSALRRAVHGIGWCVAVLPEVEQDGQIALGRLQASLEMALEALCVEQA